MIETLLLIVTLFAANPAVAPIDQTAIVTDTVAVTQHCYALHEPWKHWPTYLDVTAELDTCTMNWYTAAQFLEDERHWPSIWNHEFRPTIMQLAALAETYPDRWWLLYNEPERLDQANTSAFDAAIHARYWAEAIGENGRTACCGVLVVPGWDGWSNWLEWYIGAGGPIPDAWHIHVYASTPEQWNATLAEWDAWNQERGGNLPTIISEAGWGPEVYGRWLAFERDDVPAVFWFGLPPEPATSATNGDAEIYFPMMQGAGQ